MDGRAKHNRNEQWDAAFAILREEMEKPSPEQKRTRAAPVEEVFVHDESVGDFPEGVDWDLINRVAGMELIEDQVFQKRQFEYMTENIENLLPFDSRFPGTQAIEWAANTGHDLIRHYLPPQSLWSTDSMRRKALRKRQTWKKLAIQELSVGVLIHKMLSPAQLAQLPDETLRLISPVMQHIASLGAEENESARAEILKNIFVLQGMSVDASYEEILNTRSLMRQPGIPQYLQDDDGDFYQICAQMNDAIKQLLVKIPNVLKDDVQVALTMAKVCHNLLVSSAAPDVQTFNTLISGLKRWRLPDLVDEVIKTFTGCKIRPNEITCATILDHYIQCNRPEDFSKFVARMRGVSNALMLARPDITINKRGEKRLRRINEQKVYQKVYPNPLVFNTLMLGALRFAGCERALDIYYEMKGDGWGLDVMGLNHFLVDCIHRGDWNNGLFVWGEINDIKAKARGSDMAKAYANMLSLCSVAGNTVAFNQVLKEVVNRGFDRKTILGSAMERTRQVRSWNEFSIPAWTADNVLIAIDGYMNDASPSNSSVSSLEKASDTLLSDDTSNASPPKDSEVAWSSWIEHEFGEKIEQESTAQESSHKVDTADDPDCHSNPTQTP